MKYVLLALMILISITNAYAGSGMKMHCAALGYVIKDGKKVKRMVGMYSEEARVICQMKTLSNIKLPADDPKFMKEWYKLHGKKGKKK